MKGHQIDHEYGWNGSFIYFFEACPVESAFDAVCGLFSAISGFESSSIVKIGFTTDPVKRFRHIQTSCPHQLRAVVIRPGTKADERAIHDRFRDRRVYGEWFRFDEQEVIEIAQLRSQWWRTWHTFARNVTDVRWCPIRDTSFEEFEALCQYEMEFNNPLDRSLL